MRVCVVECVKWPKVFIRLQKVIAFAPRVAVVPKKVISKVINHLRIAVKVWKWRFFHSIRGKNSPALMTNPFDYNFIFLIVDHTYMLYPPTFIVKISKLRGTSANWPWGKAVGSLKTSIVKRRWLWPSNWIFFVTKLDPWDKSKCFLK